MDDPPPDGPRRGRWRTWARMSGGVLAGGPTGVVALVAVLCATAILLPTLLWPRARHAVVAAVTTVTRPVLAVERARIAWSFGFPAAAHRPRIGRLMVFLLVRGVTGPPAASALALVLTLGAVPALLPLYWYSAWMTEALDPASYREGVLFTATIPWPINIGQAEGTITNGTIVTGFLVGLLLLYLAVRLAFALAAAERWVVGLFFGPASPESLQRRITELTSSRSGVMAAVDEERRRIERDLHDGVQQRVVALGALLGRARRADRDKSEELLGQALHQHDHVLAELREVAQRVYPSVLDESGLEAALTRLAEDAGVSVELDHRLAERPDGQVETAVYFTVRELVGNAVKHARATRVGIEVHEVGAEVLVRVGDDGIGGADPAAGTGLVGLARRIAALDGRLHVDSPPGAGTTVTAHLPRQSAT